MIVIDRIRRFILSALLLGMVGTAVELVLLEHYDGLWQSTPLWLILAAFFTLLWQIVRPSAAALRAVRVVMVAFVVAGGLGVVLHYRGSLEFQLESDPTLAGSVLFWKVMRSKAPPALAPGLMAQLGLLGLIYAYRHPASGDPPDPSTTGG